MLSDVECECPVYLACGHTICGAESMGFYHGKAENFV